MSSALYEADAQLSYVPPAALPVQVLAVTYGAGAATPDPVETVEVAWQHLARPGVFTVVMERVGNWQASIDALLRLRVFQLEQVYATLGGWPEATPLPTDLPPDSGAFGIE